MVGVGHHGSKVPHQYRHPGVTSQPAARGGELCLSGPWSHKRQDQVQGRLLVEVREYGYSAATPCVPTTDAIGPAKGSRHGGAGGFSRVPDSLGGVLGTLSACHRAGARCSDLEASQILTMGSDESNVESGICGLRILDCDCVGGVPRPLAAP